MNCKPGDLAIATGGPKSAGRIVRVTRLALPSDVVTSEGGTLFRVGEKGGAKWHIEGSTFRAISDGIERLAPIANDNQLRPIRDNPGNESWFKAAPLTEKPKQPEAV